MTKETTTISSNREFIDTVYFYQLYKAIAENPEETDESRRKAYERMVEHYISLITRCLQGIYLNESNKKIQTEYVNYLSWNEVVICTNLDEFKIKLTHQINKTKDEMKLLHEIEKQLEAIKQVRVKFLELDSNDLGKIKEYVQAYNIVKSWKKKRPNMRLIENLSYRFVDYLNTLTAKRCCFEGFGRDECSYDDLKGEAEFILITLNEAGNLACYQITKNPWEAFISFHDNDKINRDSQDQEIAAALEFAHVRANETRLQQLERQFKEACEKISTLLREKLDETFQILKMEWAVVWHPWDTLERLWFAVFHLPVTAKALVKWAKQNKWKAGAIIIAGLNIGVAAGLLIGGPLIVGALSMELTFGVLGGIVGFSIFGVVPLMAAAGEAGLLVTDADKKIEEEKEKNIIDKQKLLNEVEPMKRRVRNEELFRERMRRAKREIEREIAIITQAEEENAKQLDYELSKMTPEEMAPVLKECQEAYVLVTNELAEVRSTRETVISRLNETRRDHQIIHDAQSAAIRIQNREKGNFAYIGIAKRMMNLEEMDIEARKSDST